jgi:hypothetical protein
MKHSLRIVGDERKKYSLEFSKLYVKTYGMIGMQFKNPAEMSGRNNRLGFGI